MNRLCQANSLIGFLKCFDATVQPDDASHRQMLLEVVKYLTESYDVSGRPVSDLDGLALYYIRYASSGGTGKSATLVTYLVAALKRQIPKCILANRAGGN